MIDISINLKNNEFEEGCVRIDPRMIILPWGAIGYGGQYWYGSYSYQIHNIYFIVVGVLAKILRIRK